MKVQKKQPELRFKGFTDDWEQSKFKDMVIRVNKSSNSNNLPKVEFEDISAGEGRLNKDISNKFDTRKGIEFESNDILYGKLRPYLKNWLMPDFKGVALGDFWIFRPVDNLSNFVYNLIQTAKYQKAANDTAGTKMPRSDWKKVSETTFYISTSLKEQQKIGDFFQKLDKAITLQQRKLELLKKLKRGYLQQMFPGKDQCTPLLRFNGFDGTWKFEKLEDVAKTFSGGTPPAGSKKYYKGKIPFIRSAEINKNETELFLTENGLANSSAKLVSEGTILYALYGATSGEVGISHINGAINQAILAIVPSDEYSILFIAQWLRNNKKKITDKYLQGGQGNLSGAIIRDLQIKFPSNKEQHLVGEFFKRTDRSITFQQLKINQLQQLKQAYLQKLFP